MNMGYLNPWNYAKTAEFSCNENGNIILRMIIKNAGPCLVGVVQWFSMDL